MTARSVTLQAKTTLAHLGKHSDQVIQTQKKSKKLRCVIRSGADGPHSGCGCYIYNKTESFPDNFFLSRRSYLFGLRSCIVYTIIK